MSFFEKQAVKTFSPGEIICREGDPGESMFVIKSGRVEVYNTVDKRKITLAKLGPGEIFGEMSIIDGRPRSATVRALTEVSCVEITRPIFDRIINEYPKWFQIFLRMLVERLRETDKRQKIADSKEIAKQIVYLTSLMLNKEERKTGHFYYRPWQELVEDISFLLDVPPAQVSKVLTKLTFTPLARSEFNYKDGKVFIVEDVDRFFKFSGFCKEKYLKNVGKDIVEEYVVRSEKEVRLLKLIDKVLSEQAKANDIEVDYLNSRCLEEYKEDLSSYDRELKRLAESGIIKRAVNNKGIRYIKVDRGLFNIRIGKYKDMELFENIEEKLGS
ncbi:MAG TPA: cyclic nucleotide-binding domain-containing protein [Candidatus Marinimicrobia bacterium]|nr:cyclic nucleotide-binding domain-containing protein [Candidatus Neomarinimicrobiota bacterium]